MGNSEKHLKRPKQEQIIIEPSLTPEQKLKNRIKLILFMIGMIIIYFSFFSASFFLPKGFLKNPFNKKQVETPAVQENKEEAAAAATTLEETEEFVSEIVSKYIDIVSYGHYTVVLNTKDKVYHFSQDGNSSIYFALYKEDVLEHEYKIEEGSALAWNNGEWADITTDEDFYTILSDFEEKFEAVSQILSCKKTNDVKEEIYCKYYSEWADIECTDKNDVLDINIKGDYHTFRCKLFPSATKID